MKLAVPRESEAGEPRVAATPDTVKKFVSLGFEVSVEKDAGLQSRILDADYEAAGAKIATDAKTTLADADMVLKVRRPNADEMGLMKKGAII